MEAAGCALCHAAPALHAASVRRDYKRGSRARVRLNAHDSCYVLRQANVGAKTIAINLPNDEEVQLRKGARRLQLKNAMRAKFDRILAPIARELITTDQQSRVTFDAFFENVMFHEVAHGLGIKNTIDNKGTVRAALKERYGSLEEGKADILGCTWCDSSARRNELTRRMKTPGVFLLAFFRSIRFRRARRTAGAEHRGPHCLQRQSPYARLPRGAIA